MMVKALSVESVRNSSCPFCDRCWDSNSPSSCLFSTSNMFTFCISFPKPYKKILPDQRLRIEFLIVTLFYLPTSILCFL